MIISDVRQHPVAGYWMASITVLGDAFVVDRRFGSWQVVVPSGAGEVRREVLPHVAEALQAELPAAERGGRRSRVASTVDGARYGRIVTT